MYPPLRRLYSFSYQQLNRVLFQLPTRDTQTGIKLIRREALAVVLPKIIEKRFAFDLELLVVARRMGYRNFVELPVQITERFTSTIKLKSVWGMLVDTLAIFYRLRIAHFYGPQLVSLASLARSPASARALEPVSKPAPEAARGHRQKARPVADSRLGGPGPGAPLRTSPTTRGILRMRGKRRRGLPAVGGPRMGAERPPGHALLRSCGGKTGRGNRGWSPRHTAGRPDRRLSGGQALLAA